MKILFLCGSLEHGKDGVGDYTRRLAGELIRQEHDVAIIALNDRYVDSAEELTQSSEGANIPILRIPSKFSGKRRFSIASKYVSSFDPEWLSLQFVPYSFSTKGLPISLPMQLAILGKGRKWHIMFHELWVQRYKKTSLKINMLSCCQERVVLRMLRKLAPRLIHTHLPLYQFIVQSKGYRILPLPLFSNIHVYNDQQQNENKNIIRLGFFGQMQLPQSVIDFINDLSVMLKYKKIEVLVIGGSNTLRMSSDIKSLCPNIDRVICTGFFNDIQISQYIQICDLGITPVPRHALGKSGSVAAFLAHDVLVCAPESHKDYVDFGIGFFCDELKSSIITTEHLCNLDNILKERNYQIGNNIKLEYISSRFLCDINNIK